MSESLDLLPWSQEAEEAVIGSLLIDPSATAMVQTIVQAADFHDDRLAEIYRACLKLGAGLDYLTLNECLKQPGMAALTCGLMGGVPTSMHLEHYASIVHRDGVRRRVIKVAGQMAQTAYNSMDSSEVLAQVQSLTAALMEGHATGDESLSQLAGEFYDKVDEWYAHPLPPGQPRHLSTGFRAIDEMTDGMEAGTLFVLCGRPSLGKSSLCMEIARRVGMAGHNVLIFSLEMSAHQILGRWASAMSGVQIQHAQRGQGDSANYIHSVIQMTGRHNIWIDDTVGLSPSQVRGRALARHIQNPLDLVVLDHGGEMSPDKGTRVGDNEAAVEGRKTMAMKALAKELRCPVLLVLQLNRAVEGRANKRPSMSDLRATGVHEQAADVILALYRESYYDPTCANPNLLEVAILKNRMGPVTSEPIQLWYEKEIQRFRDVDVSRQTIKEEML